MNTHSPGSGRVHPEAETSGTGYDDFDASAAGSDAASDVRASMRKMTQAFLHQAEDAVATQQSMVASVLRDVARSLRDPGRAGFRPETQRFLGGSEGAQPILASAFADALDTSADHVEAVDFERISSETRHFLREQPFVAAGLAAVAGLAIARLARSATR